MELEVWPGEWIHDVVRKAVATAKTSGQAVVFTFNDVKAVANVGESAEDVGNRWWADREKAYQKHQAKRRAEAKAQCSTEGHQWRCGRCGEAR